jgi:hypothetical protein
MYIYLKFEAAGIAKSINFDLLLPEKSFVFAGIRELNTDGQFAAAGIFIRLIMSSRRAQVFKRCPRPATTKCFVCAGICSLNTNAKFVAAGISI